ncbi:U-box domain-containing protein 35-like [Dorcoceras hygrometricum]|uniref:U-box domain-containing protein 35-like n=1 Tax=Dorcoceras hygrometricum TaxID=472368 RepID=A0A2Z7BKW0_9LAMI|nr:U-box domain-containing protein 35-like [Dorcoceras hygrometricum]
MNKLLKLSSGSTNYCSYLLVPLKRCTCWFLARGQNAVIRGPTGSRQASWAYDICEKLDLTDISTSWLAESWEWSKAEASKQLEEQERTAQAQLQTKRGADTEVAPDDQLEDKNK